MSSQISNNNNYATTPTSPNPYISRKLNNMDQAQHLQKIKQYRPGSSHEEGKRRLDEIIPQDIEGDRNDDQCAENSKGYEEDGRRG